MAKSGHARIVFTPVASCERVYSHTRSRLARSPRACTSSTFCGHKWLPSRAMLGGQQLQPAMGDYAGIN